MNTPKLKRLDFYGGQDSAYYRMEFVRDVQFLLGITKDVALPNYVRNYLKSLRRRHARWAVYAARKAKDPDFNLDGKHYPSLT